jgi:hypothetical protein
MAQCKTASPRPKHLARAQRVLTLIDESEIGAGGANILEHLMD